MKRKKKGEMSVRSDTSFKFMCFGLCGAVLEDHAGAPFPLKGSGTLSLKITPLLGLNPFQDQGSLRVSVILQLIELFACLFRSFLVFLS